MADQNRRLREHEDDPGVVVHDLGDAALRQARVRRGPQVHDRPIVERPRRHQDVVAAGLVARPEPVPAGGGDPGAVNEDDGPAHDADPEATRPHPDIARVMKASGMGTRQAARRG